MAENTTNEDTGALAEPQHNLPAWALAEPQEGKVTEELVTPHDYPLDLLMRFMHGEKNDLDGEFGLTVSSHGQVVTGLAISGLKWDRLLAQSLVDSGQQVIGDAFGQVMANQKRKAWELADARKEAETSRIVPNFLHFREVTVDTGMKSVRLPLWRVQLKSVDGWSLGNESYGEDSVATDDLVFKDYSAE